MICALIVILAFGVVVSAIYTARRAAAFEKRFPPLGHLVELSSGTLHFVDRCGDGSFQDPPSLPVVFLHGASTNSRDQIVAFDGKFDDAQRLIFPDRPGHGYSSRLSSAYSDPRKQAAVIIELLDHLRISKAIFVGHSWGGAVAAALGIHCEERVAGLVFIAPATHPWPGGVLWYYTLASTPLIGPVFARLIALVAGERRMQCAVDAVFSPDTPPDNYADKVGAGLVLRPRQFLANANDITDLKDNLAEMANAYQDIGVPALIVTGTEDNVVWPHLHSEGLNSDLPNSKLIRLEGAGHMPHHSQNQRVVSELKSFMKSIK